MSKKQILLYRGDAFQSGGSGRFAKDVIKDGNWIHPATGKPVVVTAERRQRLAANTQKLLDGGTKIPFRDGHRNDAKANLGYWPGPVMSHGDAVIAMVEPTDKEALGKMRDGSIADVSVVIEFDYTDSKGQHFDEVITAIDATSFPVITGQKRFLEFSRSAEERGEDFFIPAELLEFDPSQPRDGDGKWTSMGGGGGKNPLKDKLRDRLAKDTGIKADHIVIDSDDRNEVVTIVIKRESSGSLKTATDIKSSMKSIVPKDWQHSLTSEDSKGNMVVSFSGPKNRIDMRKKPSPGLHSTKSDSPSCLSCFEGIPGILPEGKEKRMDPKKLALALGLPEDSDEAKIMAALKQREVDLKASADKAKAFEGLSAVKPEELQAHGFELKEGKVVKLAAVTQPAPSAREQELLSKLAIHEARENLLHAETAKKSVDEYVKKGVVPPAMAAQLSKLMAIKDKVQALSLSADGKGTAAVEVDIKATLTELLAGVQSVVGGGLSSLREYTGGEDKGEKSPKKLEEEGRKLAREAQGLKETA